MIKGIVKRVTSRSFRRLFLVILAAQTVTIIVAWVLLGFNANRWIRAKALQAERVSEQTALAEDWSGIRSVPRGKDSELGDKYQDKLYNLSKKYFLRDEGSVYLVTVVNGEEYDISPGSPVPLDDGGKANQWEIEAYEKRGVIYSPTPIIDDSGTYLAAYTPILHDGKVVGLVAAEYDSAPLADFQNIVGTAFWQSIIPAIGVSLVVAWILAARFVEPTEVFRTIHETEEAQRALSLRGEEDQRWTSLTPKEKELAEYARQGLTAKEMAELLSRSETTVRKHLKNIREKTGWGMRELAVQAQARRTTSALEMI